MLNINIPIFALGMLEITGFFYLYCAKYEDVIDNVSFCI